MRAAFKMLGWLLRFVAEGVKAFRRAAATSEALPMLTIHRVGVELGLKPEEVGTLVDLGVIYWRTFCQPCRKSARGGWPSDRCQNCRKMLAETFAEKKRGAV